MAIPSGASADDDYVVRDFFRIARNHFLLILFVTFAFFMLALSYLSVAKQTYSPSALVQIDTDASPPTESADGRNAVKLFPSVNTMKTDTELELFKSGAVLDPVVAQFGLGASVRPHTVPVIGRLLEQLDFKFSNGSFANTSDSLHIDQIDVPVSLQDSRLKLRVMSKFWYSLEGPNGSPLLTGKMGETAEADGVRIKVSGIDAHPGATFDVIRYSQATALQMLLSRITVTERGKATGVLQVTVSGTNAFDATGQTNAIVASYLRLRVMRAQEESGRMLQFLRQELPILQAEVQRSESAVSDFESSQGTFEVGQEAQSSLSGGLELDRQLATLQIQRQQLVQKFTPQAPEIKAVDAQIASINSLKQRIDEQYKSLPDTQRKAATLQRDAKVSSEVYQSLLNKIQELAVSNAAAVGGAHLIDSATIPTLSIWPKTGPIVAGGLILGLMAGVAAAFVRDRYASGMAHPDIIERESRLPVLAVIPQSSGTAAGLSWATWRSIGFTKSAAARMRTPERLTADMDGVQGAPALRTGPSVELLAYTDPFDDSVESLRGLRDSLLFELAESDARTLVITSPAPFDGKSFISANLAALVAESGKRVLLIDADLRRGYLAQRFGLQASSGMLAAQLLEPAHHANLAQPTCVPNLYLLNGAQHLRNPSPVLSKERFDVLLRNYQKDYDLVIIDTPPLLAVPDAAVIASSAGATLLVVRTGVHSAGDIDQSLAKLRRARANVIGVVLNGTSRKLRRKNGTYDYAYAYSYR